MADPFDGIADQRRYGANYYSHSGVDLIVLNALELLGIYRTASYLDIGAHHPTIISNTALLYERGLRGVNVEANPNLIDNFLRDRPEDINLNIGVTPTSCEMDFYMIDKWSGCNSFDRQRIIDLVTDRPEFNITEIIKVPVLRLNDIVDQYCGGKFPEFLSMDIEQLDFDVLRFAYFCHRSHPRIVCVETIHSDGSQNYEAFRDMMLSQGFVTYCRTIADTIFMWTDDARRLGLG